MGIYRLVNVPFDKSGLQIKSYVEGQHVYIVCAAENSEWRDGKALMMTETYIGDHMFTKPHDLREMYGQDLATAIRLARDVGYQHALAEIRRTLGIGR